MEEKLTEQDKLLNEYADYICSGITLEDPNIFIFPKTKKEQISFKIHDIMTEKQITIIARTNVKYFLKKQLHAREWWSFEGYYNQDKSTFYVSRATMTFSQAHTFKLLEKMRYIQEHNLMIKKDN